MDETPAFESHDRNASDYLGLNGGSGRQVRLGDDR